MIPKSFYSQRMNQCTVMQLPSWLTAENCYKNSSTVHCWILWITLRFPFPYDVKQIACAQHHNSHGKRTNKQLCGIVTLVFFICNSISQCNSLLAKFKNIQLWHQNHYLLWINCDGWGIRWIRIYIETGAM